MSSKELDNLVKTGSLKSESGDQMEFNGLLDSGRKRLKDAVKSELSPESKFDLAYSAAHAFALAAMRWHGYRPANKRYVIFQALPHTLGIKPEVWRVLDKCHGLRNSLEYDGSFNVNDQLLADLLRSATAIKDRVEMLEPIAQDVQAPKRKR
jgi:hypothetical protein